MRFALIPAVLAAFVPVAAAAHDADPTYDHVQPLLSTSTAVTGEELVYPTDGGAKVTSLIVTMEPGEATGWHKHGVPTYGYILEGEITIAYKDQGERQFGEGVALMDAMHIEHNATNTGDTPTRILVVFMGDGIAENVIRDGG